jgi:transposase-like protein
MDGIKRRVSESKATFGLPPLGTRRWTSRRKAEVVAAVDDGSLSLKEACESYDLSPDEFAGWQRAYRNFGTHGLRTTYLQDYRPASRRKADH